MSALSEEALAEIRARHEARTRGPYMWYGWGGRDRKAFDLRLMTRHSGMLVVMSFERNGMNGAAPVFRSDPLLNQGGILKSAREFLHYPKDYKDEIVGLDHADATAIEHSWSDVDELLREVTRLRALVGEMAVADG